MREGVMQLDPPSNLIRVMPSLKFNSSHMQDRRFNNNRSATNNLKSVNRAMLNHKFSNGFNINNHNSKAINRVINNLNNKAINRVINNLNKATNNKAINNLNKATSKAINRVINHNNKAIPHTVNRLMEVAAMDKDTLNHLMAEAMEVNLMELAHMAVMDQAVMDQADMDQADMDQADMDQADMDLHTHNRAMAVLMDQVDTVKADTAKADTAKADTDLHTLNRAMAVLMDRVDMVQATLQALMDHLMVVLTLNQAMDHLMAVLTLNQAMADLMVAKAMELNLMDTLNHHTVNNHTANRVINSHRISSNPINNPNNRATNKAINQFNKHMLNPRFNKSNINNHAFNTNKFNRSNISNHAFNINKFNNSEAMHALSNRAINHRFNRATLAPKFNNNIAVIVSHDNRAINQFNTNSRPMLKLQLLQLLKPLHLRHFQALPLHQSLQSTQHQVAVMMFPAATQSHQELITRTPSLLHTVVPKLRTTTYTYFFKNFAYNIYDFYKKLLIFYPIEEIASPISPIPLFFAINVASKIQPFYNLPIYTQKTAYI